MTKTLKIDIDEEILIGLDKSPEELADDIRLAAAIKWYELGMLSQEKAAQIAGLNRAEFISALSRFELSPMQETAEEIIHALQESLQ